MNGLSIKPERVVDYLLADPVISTCNYTSIVRLIPYVEVRPVRAGEVIYEGGQDAGYIYFLLTGAVRLQGKGPAVDIRVGSFGEEAAVQINKYMTAAQALEASELLAVPKMYMNVFMSLNPKVQNTFFLNLMNRFSQEEIHRLETTPVQKGARSTPVSEKVGWILTVLIPMIVLFGCMYSGVSASSMLFLTIMSATILMWVFNLVAEFIPGLFAVCGTLILGLAPIDVALSGFASDSFFMAMSILGLGAVIVASGLSYRFILLILKVVPNTQFWHNFGIFLTGTVLNPVIPSINGRVTLLSPLLIDMVESLRLQFQGKAATRLAIAAFSGAGLLSVMFLSSKSVNFIVFGLLSPQMQDQFQLVGWLKASLVTGLLMLLVYALFAAIWFRNRELSGLSKDQVIQQLRVLGPLKQREWAAILALGIFIIGIVTSSIHKIQPSWIGMALLYAMLLFGSLRKDEFQKQIDWPFLMFLGGMSSAISVMHFLGMDQWLADHLTWLGNYMKGNFVMFILLLTALITLVRLVLPIGITIVIFATVFMPIAEINGINAWLIGFVILIIGDMWLFPYQCSYYTQFQDLLRDKKVYHEGAFLRFNLLLNGLKIAAIYASMPYWKWMGVM